ncbi:MAG: hypothetical protein AB8B64_23985, partial [Granulosicoccus sp.]
VYIGVFVWLQGEYTLSVNERLLEPGGGTVIGERGGRIEWNGWTLDYDTFALSDGLTLHDVSYEGTPILSQASFPVMSVYYDDDACGPYADRLNVQSLLLSGQTLQGWLHENIPRTESSFLNWAYVNLSVPTISIRCGISVLTEHWTGMFSVVAFNAMLATFTTPCGALTSISMAKGMIESCVRPLTAAS